MPRLPNIDKSGFHHGEYVGYADGVWRIRRNGRRWCAASVAPVVRVLSARTLTELSTRLSAVAAAAA